MKRENPKKAALILLLFFFGCVLKYPVFYCFVSSYKSIKIVNT